ncbi:MAG: hypothetical protein ACLR2P_12980, partial [Bilophila wadsworthia]
LPASGNSLGETSGGCKADQPILWRNTFFMRFEITIFSENNDFSFLLNRTVIFRQMRASASSGT